jgi:hypothetical protein
VRLGPRAWRHGALALAWTVLAWTVLAWAALAGTTVLTLRAGEPNDARWRLLGLIASLWLLFGLAAWLLLRLPARSAVPLVVLGGLALQALALTAPPRTSDDYLRYAWDGRVQAAGVDPYRYPPTAPELTRLRDPWLFPDGSPRLNHPDAPTIYPPVAQRYFGVVHELSPQGSRHTPWQLAAGLLAGATTLALIVTLRRTGGDPRLAVFWAWCPVVFLEAGNNAHVDVLGAFLVALAMSALARRGHAPGGAVGGALLGAAVAVKLLPALVLPAVIRRRTVVVAGAAATVVGLAYLPHVTAVGGRALGFLPGYLSEEGYGGTGRFALLRLVVPPAAATIAAAAVLGAGALVAWRRADPGRPWRAALPLAGLAFLVVGPSYPWYALLLVVLVALDGRWEWLAVAAAGYPSYFAGPLGVNHALMQRLAYGLALGAVLVATWRRAPAGTRPSSLRGRRLRLFGALSGGAAHRGVQPDVRDDALQRP